MKMAIFILGLSLCAGLIPLTHAAESALGRASKGIITHISLEDRSLLINDKQYNLTDRMQVVNKDNIATGDMILKNGQSIEFWLDDSGKGNAHVDKDKQSLPFVKRIRVLSDVKMNY